MAELPRLRVGLTLDSATFVKETRNVVASVDKMGRDVVRQTSVIERGFGGINSAIGVAKNALIGFGAAIGVTGLVALSRQIINTADEFQRMSGRIRTAIGETEDFAAVQSRLFDVAQKTRQSLGTTVEVFSRLQNALRETGISAAETLEITETLEQAIALSGASSGEASAGLLQLSQAMAAGRLQGDELRSVFENLPILARAIADEMDVTVGELRDLGKEGEITVDVITRAIRNMASTVERDFANMPLTVSDGMTRVRNSLTLLVGDAEETTSATGSLAESLSDLADVLASPQFRGEFQEFLAESVQLLTDVITGVQNAINLTRDWEDALQDVTGIDLSGLIEQIDDFGDRLEVLVRNILPEFIEQFLEWRGTLPDRLPPGGLGMLEWEKGARDTSAALKPLEVDIRKTFQQTEKLTGSTKKLTGELKRLADAGKILTQTSAQEERFLQRQEEINRKLEERIEIFREMNEEEMRRRVGQREAGGMSAPALDTSVISQQTDEMTRAFEQAQDAIQSTFADTFTNIFEGGVTSAKDFATELKSIFTRLAGEIAALMVIKPVLTAGGGLAGAAGTAGAAGLTQQLGLGTLAGGPGGFLGAPSGASLGGLLLAGGLGGAFGSTIGGLFGGRGNIGGGIAGGLGAVAGTAFFGPIGGLIGGLGGSLLGGALGGLFGGGDSKNKVRIGRKLGGLGGSSAAARFVEEVDKTIVAALTDSQIKAANRFIRPVQVKYEKQLDEAAKRALATARFGPAAQALGFRVSGITGGGRFAAEEQQRRLLEAIATKQQIEDLTSGLSAYQRQLRDLGATFDDLRKRANEYGISLKGVNAAENAAIRLLKDQRAAGIRAIQQQAAALTGGPTFRQQIEALNDHFDALKEQMKALGGGLDGLTSAGKRAVEVLKAQQRAQQDALALSVVEPFERLSAPLEEFQRELDFNLLAPVDQMAKAAADFRRIANLAAAGSTEAIQQLVGAGQFAIEQAGRFGASPAQVAMIEEVNRTTRDVLAQIERAQKEAQEGIEAEIRAASRREIDTMRELIEVGRQQIEEIKRLRR